MNKEVVPQARVIGYSSNMWIELGLTIGNNNKKVLTKCYYQTNLTMNR